MKSPSRHSSKLRFIVWLLPGLTFTLFSAAGDGAGPPGRTNDDAGGIDLQTVEQRIVERTNRFRIERGLEAVKVDQTLSETARSFAAFMARTDKYGHRADGRTPAERAEAAGYQMCTVRENIGYQLDSGGTDADELVETFVTGWIDSPPHRENLLAKHVTETAVAVAADEAGTKHFAVQLFGRPRAASFKIRVVNRDDVARNLSVRTEAGDDEIELPPGGTVKMRRCFPTQLSIDGESSQTAERSSQWIIRDGNLTPDDSGSD